MEKRYDTDLTDEKWERIRPYVEKPVGRKAKVDRREIVNAILYVARTGCQWRLLPRDFPNWSTVYSCYHRWAWDGTLDRLHADLRTQVRGIHEKKPQPTAGIVDSQSVKSTSKGGSPACSSAGMTAPRSSTGASVS